MCVYVCVAGEEFVDELKNPHSDAVTYFCSLCGSQFDRELTVTHVKGQEHRQHYMVRL